jgi:membrane protease subunit HflK
MYVDDVLTTKKIEIQHAVQRQAQDTLQRCHAGVDIFSVSLEGTAAPQEVRAAFRDVISAREDKQRAINEAHSYANRLLPRARAEAESVRLSAEAYAAEVVQKAKGDAARFRQMAQELPGRRALTTRRLLLETLEEVLPRLNKIVLDTEAGEQLDLSIFAVESEETAR